MKYAPRGIIDNMSALVQIKAWHQKVQSGIWSDDDQHPWCRMASLDQTEFIYKTLPIFLIDAE